MKHFWIWMLLASLLLSSCAPIEQQVATDPSPVIVKSMPTTASTPGLVTATCAFTSEATNITDVLSVINIYRAQNGLSPYNPSDDLFMVAQSHAGDMACNDLTGDTGSNGSTLESRVTETTYKFTFVSENIHVSSSALNGQEVVNAWINDTNNMTNRLKLISDTYIDIGIGYAFFNGKGYYVVVFGTP